MAYICNEVKSFMTQEICEPVEKWVENQKQECKKKKWWNPLTWICWLVTIIVKVIVWVTRYIIVEVINLVCEIVMQTIYIITFPFVWIIDFLFNFNKLPPTLLDKWKEWLLCTKVEALNREFNPNTGIFDYKFKCNCECTGANKPIVGVSSNNDKEATELAVIKCSKLCQ